MNMTITKIGQARLRARPATEALAALGARCMEQSQDASGIAIDRWLLPNGVSVIVYGTPDWWDIYAPLNQSPATADTLAELRRLAAQPVARLPRAQFESVVCDMHTELGEVRDVLLRDLTRDDAVIAPSITNDAEAVVSYVAARYPGRRIFYIDTEGNCDELLHVDGRFLTFGPARGRYA